MSDDLVIRYLGERSSASGVALAIVFGSLTTSLLYVAFPIASGLLEKGARVSNVIVFLRAWACFKLPQKLIELLFLGWRFTSLRFVLIALVAIGMGVLIEAIVSRRAHDERRKKSLQ